MPFTLSLLYLSRTVGALGFHMFSLYAVLRIFSVSPDLTSIGLLGLSTFLGSSATVLLSGDLCDRIQKKGSYALALHALIAVLALLTFKEESNIGFLYLLVTLLSAGRVLRSPLYFVISRFLIAKTDQSLTASRFYVVSWQLAGVIGPLLGGLLSLKFGLLALQWAFVLCFMIAVFLLLPLHKLSFSTQTERKRFWLQDLRHSFSFFNSDRVMRDSFLIDTVGVLFAGVSAFLPFLLDQLNLSPDLTGVIRAVQNGGGVLIVLFLSGHWLRRHTGRVFILSVLGFSICCALVPFAGGLYPLGLLFLALGALDGVSILVRDLLLLQHAPVHLQGKVYALNSIFISSADDLGEMESGFVGHMLGIPLTAVLGGALCAGLTVFLTLRSKQLWSFQLDLTQPKKLSAS